MRIDFKTFLTEAGKTVQQSTEQRTHSEHVNHLAFDGHDAVAEAHDGLSRLHNFLLGKKTNIPKSITTKVDGAPAAHLIKGPNGAVGVATKGLFNKNPKIAWTHEDVTKHYGHAPGLESIMHDLLDHGPKILPPDMKEGEIYKGDMLFGGERKPESRDGHISFMPNMLRYKYPKGSNEADRAQRAKIGIALHTFYDRKGRASPITDEQRNKLQSHPDVFNMDPRVKPDAANYTPHEQQEYNTHMENARREYQKLDPGAYDAMGHHNMDMRTYANDVVRRGTGEPLNTEGYINHLTQRHAKDIEKYKTQGSIDKKNQAHAAKIDEIMRNKEHFDKIFKMHDHLQKAKNVLIGVMDKNNPAHVELPNGQPTAHEGYVDAGGKKYVQQNIFSQNLLSGVGRFQKPIKESLNEDIKLPVKKHVTFIGRTQPPHAGHLHAVQGVVDHANKIGATHTILLTHTHNKDNPLTPEQKLKYAQKSFPGANIETTSPESPSLMHHASKLYANGVRDFTIFAGPERLPSYEKLLNSYNGVKGPHGYYKFDNINLQSSGDRDPDAEGVEGASGTAMKKAALAGDAETFHAMASPHMSPADKTKMMKDVQAGLAKFVKPKPKTSNKTSDFNPGTPVYVQHGSHSQEPVKESTRLSFKQLVEKKVKVQSNSAYEEMMNNEDYTDARDATVSHLQNANDHIAKGGSDEVDDVLQKHYDLSKNPHNEHLDAYSDSSYETNMDLYGHHNDGGDPNELPDLADHEHIEGLDKALAHSKTKKPMTVFSGVGFHPGQMAAQHPKKQLYMPAYTSTSIDPTVAASFARAIKKGSPGDLENRYNPDRDENSEGADHHILRINLPKGHPGAYIAGSSFHPEEKEFLLPRQQTMKISPKPEIHEFNDGYATHRMHIWDATPVPTKLPKPVQEETVSGGEMVRGFGDVSGNPAVQDNPLQQYFGVNSLAADKQNGAVLKLMKDSQLKYNMVGFKAFNPSTRDKSLQYYQSDVNADPLLRDKIRNRGKNNNVTKG